MRRRVMFEDKKPDTNTLLLLDGDNYIDKSTYKQSVVNYGVSLNSNGRFGGCFYFNKSNYMLVDTLKQSSPFTFEAYIKASNTQNGTLCSSGSGSIHFRFVNGRLNATKEYVEDLVYANETFPVNNWVHAALVYTGNKVLVFQDGTKVIDFSYSSFNVGNGLCIGVCKSNKGEGLIGYADEIRVSNIARWTSNFTPPTKPY